MKRILFDCILFLKGQKKQVPRTGAGAPSRLPMSCGFGLSSLVFWIFLIPFPAYAAGKPVWHGPYAVTKPLIKDGDTAEVTFNEGPCGRGPCAGSIWGIRIRGIDAPEIHQCRSGDRTGRGKTQSCAKCSAEYQLGLKARDTAKALVDQSSAAQLSEVSVDAYAGRLVGRLDLKIDGTWQSLGDRLEVLGLAVPYDPAATGSYKKIKPWCGAP